MRMVERSDDWMRQARRDLESARHQADGGFHGACFAAQQAAEKAVKAAYASLGAEAWGHAVANLLTGLREEVDVPDDLVDHGRRLDRYYVPARYPNGWNDGSPGDYYDKEDSKDALSSAEEVLRFCDGLLA